VSRPRLVFRKRVKPFGPLYLNVALHHVGLGVHVPGASFSINDTGRATGQHRTAGLGLASAASLDRQDLGRRDVSILALSED
jgi:hypothetical protein